MAKQITANSKVAICAMNKSGSKWLRLSETLVEDNRLEPKVRMLEAYPKLKPMYKPEYLNMMLLYFKEAEATFCGFNEAPSVVKYLQ